jgi:RimJ/RimL family protein N-acetyltransferase
VFGHNAAALALYRDLGFEEAGTVTDRFRIDGRSIDDVIMTLNVGSAIVS